MPLGIWNAERDAYLTKLRGEGYSSSQIAVELGRSFDICVTRSAVIGRAARLGLCVKKLNAADRKHTPEKARLAKVEIAELKAQAPKLKKIRHSKPGKHAINTLGGFTTTITPPDLKVVDPEPLRCVEVEPLNLSLMDLTADTCRYPNGGNGEPITFCGRTVWGKEQSYCAEHHALCHRLGWQKEAA